MQQKKKLITACVTIFAAAFTAHLMQRNGAEASRGVSAASVTPVVMMPGVADQDTVQSPVTEASGSASLEGTLIASTETGEMGPETISSTLATPDPFAEMAAETLVPIIEPPSAEPERIAEAMVPVIEPPVIESAVTVEDAPATVQPATVLSETPIVPEGDEFLVMPHPPEDALIPATLDKPAVDLRDRITATASEAPAEPITEQPPRNQFGLTCGIILTASPAQAAMIDVTLTAPCRGEEPIVIRHGVLTFSAQMDQLGTYAAQIPALLADGAVEVEFPDGETTGTFVEIADFDAVERVLLQSRGEAGLQIHAREFGADYGEAGHVWNGAPRDPDSAARVSGGFLTVLGDASIGKGHVAEVYTYPTYGAPQDGVVRLSLEAEVTTENCGLKIAGETQQIGDGATAQPVALTLAMPDCDAVGEYLVLKNILRDLKLASND